MLFDHFYLINDSLNLLLNTFLTIAILVVTHLSVPGLDLVLSLEALIQLVDERALLSGLGSCDAPILASTNVGAAHTEARAVSQVHFECLASCKRAPLLSSIVETAALVVLRVLKR